VKPDSEVARAKTVKFTELLGPGDGCGHPMDVKKMQLRRMMRFGKMLRFERN
jgi:hypothetical protein